MGFKFSFYSMLFYVFLYRSLCLIGVRPPQYICDINKNNMASFRIAWQISGSFEGYWSAKPEKGSESEEYIYGAFWGTNFGLTGKYVKEFAGFKANQKAQFQKMNGVQAGAIWERTRWAWMQGNQIQNQEIANLMFDWSVRRWNSLIKGVAEVLNVPVTSITKGVKNKAIGGIPQGASDGFLIFTPAVAMLINRHPNPRQLFEDLKRTRLRLDNPQKPSIVARYNNFNFDNTQPKAGGVLAYNLTRTVNDSTPSVQTTTEQDNSNGLVLLAAGFLAFKILT